MTLLDYFQVYLNAIEGHIPPEIVRTFRAFLEYCYIARQEYITEEELSKLEDALAHFHENCAIFETSGVQPDGFNLPWQHALVHYLLRRLVTILPTVCHSASFLFFLSFPLDYIINPWMA